MDQPNLSAQALILNEDQKAEYEQFGREEAQKSKGEPGQLKERLPLIYSRILENAKQDLEASGARKVSTENEISRLRQELNLKKAGINSSNGTISTLEEQKLGERTNLAGDETLSFYIGAFITILLTLYLYSFYAASGYAAFNGVGKGVKDFSGIFSSLENAVNRGGFITAITFLFPTIFIGLGFLLHDGLQHKRYGIIAFLLIFTLCFDFIIGFQITRYLYNNSYNAGETEVQWQNLMVWTDINFYIILTSGFVCYIMWGFLLNYTLNKFQEIQPGAHLNHLDNKIKELQNTRNLDLAAIQDLESSINEKQKFVDDLTSGKKVAVNPDTLQAVLGVFMGGWCEWIHLMRRDEANDLIPRSQLAKDEWLENILKIQ